VKLTGERPIEGKTPSSLLALHAAGYDAVIGRLGSGRVLDLGCGLGDESARLGGPGRSVLGIDYDPVTAAEAARTHDGLLTTCADGAVLPLRGESFDVVCSSHLIEHFVDPEHHVAEISRVLTSDGSAFFLTPNKPADFENPYHVYLFDPADLALMLGRHFDDVTVFGLDGDAAVKADFERRRKLARRLLAIDVLGLRHRLPRGAYVTLHATARRLAYPVLATVAKARRGRGTPEPVITASQFSLTSAIDPSTLVLFAVARQPRRRSR
jgi:SAM-dependent methyltransferase